MDELRNLYKEVIIDHSHHPRNCSICKDATLIGEGYNPLCGDKLTLFVNEKNGIIEDISFQGEGCAIFMASASMMTEAVKGKTVEEAKKLYEDFHLLVTSQNPGDLPDKIGKLAVFSGVAEFPIRVKCATLPWHTLKELLTKEKRENT